MPKGDALASGGKSATFGPPKVSQEKWDIIFGDGTIIDDAKTTTISKSNDRKRRE